MSNLDRYRSERRRDPDELSEDEELRQRPAPGKVNLTSSIASPRAGRLPSGTQSRMESAYGRSFSDVRVHENSSLAGGSTHAVTQGSDIHFGAGRFQPGDARGDWLIAHELAHVVQQSGGGARGSQPFDTRGGGDRALEVDADRAADAAVSGGRAQVALSATAGARQAYEAYEHNQMGSSHGGDNVHVTTTNGVRLTYGQVVALSGDFYRSPEALMNAPADELNAILAVMADEQRQAAANGGAPTQEQIDTNNMRYEDATSGRGSRASPHRHGAFGEDDDHDHGEDHDHGRVEDGEHVESSGDAEGTHGGESAGAEDTFLDLAQANSSHFSPENIKNNYKPKHQLALDLAKEAWELNNPSGSAAPMEPGVSPSTREGDLPGERGGSGDSLPDTGAAPTGADASDESGAGPDTGTHDVDVNAGGAERKESMAWLSNGFADHYLTDAFAGGHLVSGVVGRRAGTVFYAGVAPVVNAIITANIRVEYPLLPPGLATLAGAAITGVTATKAGSVALKLVHDRLNSSGVSVKNAKGTAWTSTGDGNLANSPETRAQGNLSSKASRDSVEDVLKDGTTDRAMEALDFIPDVAEFAGSGFMPIADFSSSAQVFTPLFMEGFLTPGVSNPFWVLVRNNVRAAIKGEIDKKLAEHGLPPCTSIAQGVARLARAEAGERVDNLRREGQELLDRAEREGRELLDEGRRRANRAVERGGELLDEGRRRGGELLDDARETGGEMLDEASRRARRLRRRAERAADDPVGTVRDLFDL